MEDVNLRLAVLDALLESGAIPRGDVEARIGVPAGDPGDDDPGDDDLDDDDLDDDDDKRDYRYRPEVTEALLAVPVTAAQRATVTRLIWQAGCGDVMSMIWKYWDGESDEFCIRSFDGIAAALPNLREFAVDMHSVSDLTPLAGCTDLHTLHLDGGFSVTDLGPLASLTALRDVQLGHQAFTDLAPLAGIAIERLDLSGNSGGGGGPWVIDLAALRDMPALRHFTCLQTVRRASEVIPMRTAFDNARVLEEIRARGVTVRMN